MLSKATKLRLSLLLLAASGYERVHQMCYLMGREGVPVFLRLCDSLSVGPHLVTPEERKESGVTITILARKPCQFSLFGTNVLLFVS